jgi:hypothetical protein
MANMLIDRGDVINVQDNDGNTPLHLALNVEMARMLISRGANIHTRNSLGKTPTRFCSVSLSSVTSVLAARSCRDADLGGQEQDFKRSRIQLECPVCLDADVDADAERTFMVSSCVHPVCRECVSHMHAPIRCPVCRAEAEYRDIAKH